jgi:hypothetical protein
VNRALDLLKPGGVACIALYKCPRALPVHMFLKRTYNRSPRFGRKFLQLAYGLAWLSAGALLRRHNPVKYVRDYGKNARGMTFWRDVDDWLGGLPFECTDTATFRKRLPAGYDLERVVERPRGACNEYLVVRARDAERRSSSSQK